MASSRKRLTGGKYEKLNDMVHAWYKMARAKNFSFSGPMLKEKALKFSEELGLTEFKASDGWLTSWKFYYLNSFTT